jgi:hypothetical protein
VTKASDLTRGALALLLGVLVAAPGICQTTTIQGFVLDPNWYAPHPRASGVYGTGMYEYGVAGNIVGSSLPGLFTSTENYPDNYWWGIFGFFRKPGQAAGTYTIATWDTWWRSTFLFNQSLSGAAAPLFLRLNATMWSYAPTWTTGHNEFGQTFAATGSSVVMVVLRNAAASINGCTISIHRGGPAGPQVGPARTFNMGGGLGDTRIIWNGGEVPTIPGEIYYVKIKAPAGQFPVLCNNEPVPDFSDPAPEGAAYHDGALWAPDRDLGLTICSDDDGLLTNMFLRSGGTSITGAASVGQTFTARGTSLISFCAWIPDSSANYRATLYDSVGGTPIGTPKVSRLMRWGDPEVMWTWGPGECPLTPGKTYYLEITREGGGTVGTVYTNPHNAYGGGQAHANRSPVAGMDLAGTIMEEESPGSATMPRVQITGGPTVSRADRAANAITIRWTTNLPSSSKVELAPWIGPYTGQVTESSQVTTHVVTVRGLAPNTMYHMRVSSAAPGARPAVSRDFVACTLEGPKPNLLANPSFEEGSGPSPRKPVPGWNYTGMDIGASDGSWFWGLPPYHGSWFLQGAINGGDPDARVWQRVTGVTPGKRYNFTCAVTSWMRENDTWKYDVWHNSGRLDQIRIGIDSYGGTNPDSPNVQWTPNMYSHLRYTTIGTSAVAASSAITVFVQMRGRGGQWHLYGLDDCILTEDAPPDTTPPTTPVVTDEGAYTLSTSSLTFSWTSGDPESGIAGYRYAIGTSPGAADVVPWTAAGLATQVTRTGLNLSCDQAYYASVIATNGAGLDSAPGTSDGIRPARQALTIAQAKSYPDGTAVHLADKAVTARIGAAFWIEEEDRSSGIRVQSSTDVDSGNRVTLTGLLATSGGERRLQAVEIASVTAGTPLDPLVMGNRALGGTGLNAYTPGVAGAIGPNNVGLLVTVYGRVTGIADDHFFIDDGAGLRESGSQTPGVRVQAAPEGLRSGETVAVTGISSIQSAGSDYRRLLLPVTGGIRRLAGDADPPDRATAAPPEDAGRGEGL